MAKLDGKVALITGGTTGIGAATARLFRDEGATVIATGANPGRVEAARAELAGVELVLCDQSDPAAIRRLADEAAARHGRIDHTFVNAGVAGFQALADVTEAEFDREFAINVRGALFTAQAVAPHTPAGGSVTFTGSTAGSMGFPGTSVYSATKAAVRSFARTLGAELAPRGVRVNTISPGPIDTPILGKNGASPEEVEAMRADFTSKVPLGRFGEADEIARIALFLATDATFMTGEELIAGGGMGVI